MGEGGGGRGGRRSLRQLCTVAPDDVIGDADRLFFRAERSKVESREAVLLLCSAVAIPDQVAIRGTEEAFPGILFRFGFAMQFLDTQTRFDTGGGTQRNEAVRECGGRVWGVGEKKIEDGQKRMGRIFFFLQWNRRKKTRT